MPGIPCDAPMARHEQWMVMGADSVECMGACECVLGIRHKMTREIQVRSLNTIWRGHNHNHNQNITHGRSVAMGLRWRLLSDAVTDTLFARTCPHKTRHPKSHLCAATPRKTLHLNNSRRWVCVYGCPTHTPHDGGVSSRPFADPLVADHRLRFTVSK